MECVRPDIDDAINLFKMVVFWSEEAKQEKIARLALESASLRLATLATSPTRGEVGARCIYSALFCERYRFRG